MWLTDGNEKAMLFNSRQKAEELVDSWIDLFHLDENPYQVCEYIEQEENEE